MDGLTAVIILTAGIFIGVCIKIDYKDFKSKENDKNNRRSS